MKPFKFSNEHLFYLVLFLLALGYRLVGLARLPLSDAEASLALPALALSRGEGMTFFTQPGYLSLTSILFFLFGASDFLARLIPALSGSLLIFAPLGFQHQLGKRASLTLAVFLAVDPGLMAFSRTAGDTMLALAFTVLALAALVNRRTILAGMCAGLALLGGAQLWPGLISGGLALWLSGRVLSNAGGNQEALEDGDQKPGLFSGKRSLFWLSAAITVVTIATQFFTHLGGLSGLGSGLVDFAGSWANGFKAPAIQSLLLFFFYEPFFLLLALFRGLRAWFVGDALDKFFMRWMILAALLSLVNPGQSFSSVAWVLLPMLALAARQVGDLLPDTYTWHAPASAQAIVTFSLVIFSIQNLLSLVLGSSNTDEMRLKIIAVGGSLVILALASFLLGTSWGWAATGPGFGAAAAGLLLFSILSASWHAAGLGQLPDREMWREGRTVISGDLLKTTVGDISEFNTGRRDRIDVRIVGIDSPAMDWLLRDFPRVSHANEVVGSENSSVVVTPAEKLPPLGDRYRGQKLTWANRPAWDLINPDEWALWMFFRQATPDPETVILWVRSDLFPGSASAPQTPAQ